MAHEDMADVDELLTIARENPSKVDWESLRPYLSHDNNDVRARAVETAAELIEADPESAFAIKTILLELATDEYIAVSQQALAALDVAVEEYPDEFKDALAPIIAALSSDIGTIRML